MAVATVKASLVAAYFMHLLSERKVIYAILTLTMLFFVVLFAVPSGWASNGTGDSLEQEHPAAEATEH